jgi:hypothetical protein
MNRGRWRWLLRLAIASIASLIVLLLAFGGRTRNLTVENRSRQSIAELNITVGGRSKRFENVREDAEVTAPFSWGGDDRFQVEGRLANGTRVRANGRLGDTRRFLLLPGGLLQPQQKK